MKKLICLILSICIMFSIIQISTIVYAEEITGLAGKTDLLEKIGLLKETSFNEFSALEAVQADFFKGSESINNNVNVLSRTEYNEQLSFFQTQNNDIVNCEEVSLFSSRATVSYYSGTTIPTYTYVTGRSLYDLDYSDDGKYVFYTYKYDIDEHFYYIDYLIDNCGWLYYDDTTASDESYATIYLVKNNKLLSITANFKYGLTTILFERPTTVSATSVSLNTTFRSMIVGNKYTLEATVNPSNTTDKSITWSSSKPSVASVSSDGIVTAKSAGSATITAKTSNGKKATCSITVKNLVLEYYPDTNIPTFTCVTGIPLTVSNFGESDDLIMYLYELDIQSHANYEVYLINNGWEFFDEEIADDYSYYTASYTKDDTDLLVVADFTRGISAVVFESKKIFTKTSVNGKKFTVQPKNVPKGSTIIFACYNENELTDTQLYSYNNESSVYFTTTKEYTNVKIFVWKNFKSLLPLCNEEIVSLK